LSQDFIRGDKLQQIINEYNNLATLDSTHKHAIKHYVFLLGKNKIQRKDEIEREITLLQESNHLPPIKNPQIEINDKSAVINMELFSKIRAMIGSCVRS
jgi:hypothetical protein